MILKDQVTDYCVFLDKALISWRSKKQIVVSLTSCEAEYRALRCVTCDEVQWFLYLLADLHIPHSSPAILYCDNKSTI